ncbi:regulatory GntR family protein [Krasilnikovia cinnamomea]|uniref:Regulatory GntR family protein n=1 Tax=Krasilnikovia cinnamomea TaxID=349313 RepID=A0A4Q7ZP81_9ACTN|nr:GntR family transcriptional regulator [Krasilnikovia cinnamomea]RZU52524.1 regulatory GntR family protein [Krasilnikovia cinnamomea]
MTSPRQPLNRSEALHQQVARNIRNEIEAGILKDGQALPSTRELAGQWDVSVFTISEAMKVLMEEGLVISQSRSRRTVRAPTQPIQRAEFRSSQPHVIMVGGFAGSGKTELGRILARQTGWPILDKDTLTRPVVEAALELLGLSPNDRESDTYVNTVRPGEYEALIAATHENLECGNSAIVTAPFIREFGDAAWISRTIAQFSASHASTTLVWMYCDEPTMRSYIRKRGAARDAAKLADWSGYISSVGLDFRPVAPFHLVDNSASSAPLQEQAQDLLKSVLATEADG